MWILAIFQLVLKILIRSVSEYRTHVVNCQWQHIIINVCIYLHLDQSTGWEMTPSGFLLSCLQRIAEDCVQDWRKKMDCCHSQWWCSRGGNRNKDTAQTQMSFSDRYGVLLIFRSKFTSVVPGLCVGTNFGVCLLRFGFGYHEELIIIKDNYLFITKQLTNN